MKHRGLSLLLVVTLLLSLFMFGATAFAASNEQNGLSAELITDKQEYTAGEEVGITLKVKNASAYVNNIWAKLVLPESLRLKQGDLDSGVFELEINGEEEFTYTADTPAPSTTTTAPTTTVAGTTAAGTTVAGTTGSGTTGGPSDTGDVSLYIYGGLALFSLIGLLVVMGGFKGLLKNRWFVLVLCVALLMPVVAPLAANAAISQKFFEVVANVKVDGEDAQIKAVITYDFDDGIYPAAEVEFKADGESLYNLVGEMGWFTPCNSSIKVDGVAASNTSRPEVDASYISMLFGCINTKTNTFVPGILDNSQIISEDAEKQLLVGRTEDKASLKALDLIGQDEWIIAEIDGKIVVTGWYDNATVAAVQHLYNLVKDQDDVTLQLPIKGDVDGYIADIPDLEDGTFFGGMDSSEGAVILRYSIEDVAAFEAYAEKLEDEGYSVYAENEIAAYGGEKHLFATYVKGDSVVHVSYFSDSFMEADVADLTANEYEYYKRSFRPIGKEVRIAIDSKAALFTNAANNDYTDLGIKPKVSVVNLYNKVGDGNNNAECLIYTLADGSFIIVDGGFAQDADQVFRALTELNERPDGKIVVAAWFMSHHHGDHVGAFKAMADKDYAKDIYIEQFIYNPTAATYNWRSMNAPFNYSMDFNYSVYNHEYMSGLLAKFGDGDTQIVNPHVGQRMMIRNAEVEFIFTGDEDLYPIHIDNTNDTSMVFSVNFKGKDGEADSTMMVLNDSCVDSQYGWIMPLFSQAMDCDIVQVAHHGLGGPSTALYRMMEPIVAIWCSTESTAIKNNWFVEKDGGGAVGGSAGFLLYRKADDTNKPVALRMLAEHHVQTLVLPYKAGDPVIKRNLGTYKSNFFELNNVKIATMAAGKFGGDLEACLDAVAEYLLAENADILGLTDVTADQVETIAEALGYPYYGFAPIDANAANSAGNLLLSRYPMDDFDVVVANTCAFAVALLDVEGIGVDVALLDLENPNQLNGVNVPKQGDYQIIMGVTAADMAQSNIVAAVPGNANENIYAMTQLASGVKITNGKVEDAAEKAGVEDLGKLVSGNLILSRKHLIEDFEEGSFDDVPTVAIWWANYLKDLNNKEQVLTWLLKNKPEIIGLDHMPLELLSDEGAAEFAQLAGYEYFAWTRKHTVNDTTAYGQLLLSHYPMEDVGTVILRDIGAEGGEGRRYLRATVTMPGGEKVDVYVGDTDGGATRAEQLATLEAAVKARSEANNGRDFFILSCDAAIPAEFAGKTMKVYNGDGSYIAISGNYPVDGMRTYGTKAYPHDGRSPIGTTLPNIDKYSKVELADLPEYNLTVNGGTGAGAFQEGEEVYAMAGTPGKGMVFTGWTAEGITLEDPMAVEQVFEMPANKVTLTATYKAVAYTERLETGDNSNELKVAVLPVYRFQGKFAIFQDQILENIRSINADVLAVTIVDYDSTVKLNTTIDVVPTLKEALADLYQYSFFAPATLVGTPSDTDPGAGYVGHLLLSKYPILSNETIELNSEPSEVRMVGHSIINVGTESEPTRLGVYYSHLGSGSNWTSGKQNLYDVVASANEDAYVMIGKFHYTDNKATIAQKLGTTVAAKDANLTIFGSENITVKADSYGENTVLKDAFTAAGYNTIEKLYYATVSMPLYEDGDTKYPVTIVADDETTVNGWYAANSTVSITAPAAPAGYKFDGWTLPTGLVLTEGTTADATIKFAMPATAVELSMAYAENPTGTVSFNVNGGFGTIADVTANVGDYTLPTTAGVLSPAGKKFAGWGLTATATKADAVNTAVVTKNATTTVYAIWEDDPNGYQFYFQWATMDTVAKLQGLISDIKAQDADYVGFSSIKITASGWTYETLVEALDYPYHVWMADTAGTAGRGSLVLSKTPVTLQDSTKLGNNCSFHYLTTTIGGKALDLFAGFDTAKHCENFVKGKIDASGNAFVMFAHSFDDNVTTWAGKPITYVADTTNKLVVSTEKLQVYSTEAIAQNSAYSVAGNTKIMIANVGFKKVITFNAGEGSGNQAPAYADNGGSFTLPTTTTFTAPTGKRFVGWAETENGAAISGTSINITGDKTLYAVWEEIPTQYTVTFNANGGYGTMAAVNADVGTYTLPANGFTRPGGKVFAGWSESATGTPISGTTITVDGPKTLYAIWEETENIEYLSWWASKVQTSGANTVKNEILSRDPDVAALVSVYGSMTTDGDMEAYAESFGYPYYYWQFVAKDANNGNADRGNIILSKFPLTEGVSDSYGYIWRYTADIRGTNVDIYVGYDCNGKASMIKQRAVDTGNDFVLLGHTFGSSTYKTYDYGRSVTGLSDGNMGTVVSLSKWEVVGTPALSNVATAAGGNASTKVLPMTVRMKKATVSFNANGGTGTMANASAIGSYTLPANGFTAPTGHQFKGWATSANGEVLPSLNVTGNTELFAIWEPVSLKLMQWWINNPSTSDMALIKQEVATHDADIVALISINNQASAATYAAEFGYTHYYFAAQPGTTTTRGNILLSKYPIEFIKTQEVVRNNGTKNYMDCFQVNVAGAELDVYTGYDIVPANAATYFQTNKAESGNDFVMMMHVGWTLSTSFAGETITASSYPASTSANLIALSQNKWQLVGSFTTPAIGVGITTAGVNKTVVIGTIQYKAN